VGRAVHGRITDIAVYIGGRLVDHLSGHDLSAARIDLRGLPPGRSRVKVVVHVQQGGRTRVVTLHRRYRTCTPKRGRHGRRHAGRRAGRGRR
jgi:hypothetical protein